MMLVADLKIALLRNNNNNRWRECLLICMIPLWIYLTLCYACIHKVQRINWLVGFFLFSKCNLWCNFNVFCYLHRNQRISNFCVLNRPRGKYFWDLKLMSLLPQQNVLHTYFMNIYVLVRTYERACAGGIKFIILPRHIALFFGLNSNEESEDDAWVYVRVKRENIANYQSE